MKKLLSMIVTLAMLLSCIAPALSVSAADSDVLELAIEEVTFDPESRGDVLTAKAIVSIVNNPGFAAANWYFYANNTELEITSVAEVQDGEDGENLMTIVSETYGQSSTLGARKKALQAAGVATGSAVKVAVIGLECADGETDVTYTGAFLEVTMTIAKDKADVALGDSFEFGVVPGIDGECYNVNEDEVVFEAPVTGKVTAATDPNKPEYADKSFDNLTFYIDDVTIPEGVDTVEVGIGIDGTNELYEAYGLVGAQIAFVYPGSFTIIDCKNGGVLTDTMVDLAYGDTYAKDASALVKERFAYLGYDPTGTDDKYVNNIHASNLAEETYSGQLKESGYINIFTFDVSKAEPGTYEFLLVMYPDDALGGDEANKANPVLSYDLDNGSVTIKSEGCEHASQTTETLASTCTMNGKKTVVCDDCGVIISEELLPLADHTPGADATCTEDQKCEVCGETIKAASGHTPGEKTTVVLPTTESEGKWEIKCEVCGETLDSGSIPALVSVKLSVESGSVKECMLTELDLKLDNCDGYFIAIVDIAYDTNALYFEEFVSTLQADVIVTNYAEGVIRVYIEAIDNTNLTDPVLGTLCFYGENAGVETVVSATVVDLINYAGDDIACEVVNGVVNVLPIDTFELSGATVEVGDAVELPLTYTNNSGIWAIRAEFNYDPAVLEFTGVKSGLFETLEDVNYSVEDGVITVFVDAADMNDVVEDGVLYTLCFKALTEGNVYVEYVFKDLIDVDGNNLREFMPVNNWVEVTACTHADEYCKETITPATVYETGLKVVTCEKCGEVVSEETIAKLPAIAAGEAGACAGNIVVPVDLLNNLGLWSVGVEVAYNEDVLTFTGITSGLFEVSADNASAANGVVTVFVDNGEMVDVAGDGAAFYLTFDVNAAADAGEYALTVKPLEAYSITVGEEVIDLVGINGKVVVAEHELEHYDEIPACHTEGFAEYWECTVCWTMFSDADAKNVVEFIDLITPATKALIHVPAVEATCHQNGMQEYWYCEDCDAVFADENGRYMTNRRNLVIPAENALEYVAAVEATCHQNGSAEYWYCPVCDAVFADAAGTQLTNRKNLTIVAEQELTYVPAVEATCHQNGSAEYWYCEICDAVFADAAGTQLTNRKNLTIVAEQALTYVPAVDGGCHQTGMQEYWYCEICDAVFADAAGIYLTNRKNLTIAPANELVYVAPVAPTFEADGMREYWYCPVCDAVFADAAGTQLTNRKNLVIPAGVFEVIPGYSASRVDVSGYDMTVHAMENYSTVAFAFAALPEGATVTVPDFIYVAQTGNETWYRASVDVDSYVIVITFADGTSVEVNVTVVFDNEIVTGVEAGWSVESAELNGDVITLVSKSDMTTAAVKLLTEETDVKIEILEGVAEIVDGMYIRANIANGAVQTIVVKVTVNNHSEIYTINVTFVGGFIQDVEAGWTVETVELDEVAKTITVAGNGKSDYVAFRVYKNWKATITVVEGDATIVDGEYVRVDGDSCVIRITLADGRTCDYTVVVK